MEENKMQKNVGIADNLASCMAVSVAALRKKKQFPAVHNCLNALRSFTLFWSERKKIELEECKPPEIPMHEAFTQECLKEYEAWLFENQYSMNTVSTYMRSLQTLYRLWKPPGTKGYNPVLFKNVYTRVEAGTKRALTAEQMEKLINANLCTLTAHQQQVLAYFLLMFMLRGMPFIDLCHLHKKDFQGGRIIYRRHKTGVLLVVDVPPEALRLIQKYRDKSDGEYLFPMLNKVAENVQNTVQSPSEEEIRNHYQCVLRRYNRELAKLMKVLLPGVKVSSYTARHTWATVAYHLGVSVGLISESMGHSSIQVTMIYLKPFDAEVIDKINRLVIATVRKSKKKKNKRINHLYDIQLK